MKKQIQILLLILLTNMALQATTPLDFDGDGKTDFGIVRKSLAGGVWLDNYYVHKSNDGSLLYQQWGGYSSIGIFEDTKAFADYDGDGKTDFAVFRRFLLTGQQPVFLILNSSDNTIRTENFGQRNDYVSQIAGDYDGDSKADLIVFRKFSGADVKPVFIYKGSFNNPNGILSFIKMPGDFSSFLSMVPLNGDFDGDNKFDFCLSDTQGQFKLLRSSDFGVEDVYWGGAIDDLLLGDFDGDNRADIFAIKIDSQNRYVWSVLERDGGGTGNSPIIWGDGIASGSIYDQLIVGDYDFDGKSDIGVYRAYGKNPNTFYIRKADGSLLTEKLGIPGDYAIPIR